MEIAIPLIFLGVAINALISYFILLEIRAIKHAIDSIDPPENQFNAPPPSPIIKRKPVVMDDARAWELERKERENRKPTY